MTEAAVVVFLVLAILAWAATSVVSFRAVVELRARIPEAPEELRGVLRATAARLGSHVLLRTGFVAVLLDVLIDGDVDWGAPVLVVSVVVFIGAVAWNAVAAVGRRGDPRVQRWTRVGMRKEDEMPEQDELAAQPYEDPGWLPAFRRVGLGGLRRRQAAEMDGVMATRLVFLSLLLSALLILYVLTFVIERVGAPDAALASMVVFLGIGGIAAAAWTANRKLDIANASALAQSYRANFFLGFALNQAPLLISFVLCFMREELWPYLVDLPLYLIGMMLIAPSRRNLERRQEQIHRHGSTLSLGRALSHLPRPGIR